MVMTLHSADERKLFYGLNDKFEILQGSFDPIIKMANKAIYSVQVSKNEKLYIVFARDRNTKADSILLFEPKTHKLRGGISLSPERISTSIFDDKGVMDIDGDRNLEVVVPVINLTRKRVRIYKISRESLIELKINMPTDYSGISINDFDLNGKYEIVLKREMNSVPLLPHILKWDGRKYSLTKVTNYPRIIEENLKELNNLQEKVIKLNNKLIILDVSLSKTYTYLKIGDYLRFGEEIDKIHFFQDSEDASIKLRVYKSKIYIGYLYLDRGEAEKAYDYLKDAVLFMYSSESENFIESMIYTELAHYFIDNYEFEKAKESLSRALKLYQNNEIAKNYLLALDEIN